ncbi:MAG: hypothetical protein IIC78_06275 [Chloroflexi bacterium]|nr:hypothetical protein [Chloroflexota bacterium]
MNHQLAIDPLTAREMDILRRMAERLTDREIAQEFVLNLNTIKWHNRQITASWPLAAAPKR